MERKKIVINFNKNFYTIEAIKKAIQGYKEMADFNTICSEKENKVEIENINPESEDVIKQEFCNYVLGLMKNV
jgi:hypothetical protein